MEVGSSEQAVLRVGLLGAGQMATALTRGWLAQQVATGESVVACDVSAPTLQHFVASTGARGVGSLTEVSAESDVIVIAVKPQAIGGVLTDLAHAVTSQHLVVSIAAGVSLSRMEHALPAETRIVRVMPNTPALVGAGVSAFAVGRAALPGDAAIVRRLLGAVGLVAEVPESQLDAITGLSGSGPAYAYQIIEALSDAGVRVGLPRDLATRFAAQTLLGSAQMVLQTGQHPAVLKDAVTSPGGTTIAGLHALEQGGLRAALINAVVAATERSKELGRAGH